MFFFNTKNGITKLTWIPLTPPPPSCLYFTLAVQLATSAEDRYVPPRVACATYGVSRSTLARWARQGRVRSVRTGDGSTAHHRYHWGDICQCFKGRVPSSDKKKKEVILYASVSSTKQKEAGDLTRQVRELRAAAPHATRIITDVASGLNFKRRGLESLLDAVDRGDVSDVVITYRDRLA